MEAVKLGVEWVDSTVTGMGRGPGNAQTEYTTIAFADYRKNPGNNIKLLEIISKTHEFIDNEDWMYLYLALIEIGKKNIKLAKKYLNLSENVTNNPKIIKKIMRIEF